MDWFFNFFEAQMEMPQPYGWFHLMMCGITLVATIIIACFFRKCSDKTFRKIFLILWIIMFVGEVYKQVLYLHVNNGVYNWEILPFQFCSSPLYVFPFIIFMKDGKVRDAFLGFTAFFVLFAGIGVLAVPTCFDTYIGISIQSMVHHGIQIVAGILVAIHEYKKLNIKYFLSSLLVLIGFIAVAILLNEVLPLIVPDKTIFLFYISRHFPTGNIPVLSNIQANYPYIVFVLGYIVGFSLVGFILYVLEKYIQKLIIFIKSKTSKKIQSKTKKV